MKKTRISIAIIGICISLSMLGNELRSPLAFHHSPPSQQTPREIDSFISFPFLLMIKGYQKILGPIKGSYCPMHPSCSNYGISAIQRHALPGVLMTLDRLHRCGHDLQFYHPAIIHDGIKYLDFPIKGENKTK